MSHPFFDEETIRQAFADPEVLRRALTNPEPTRQVIAQAQYVAAHIELMALSIERALGPVADAMREAAQAWHALRIPVLALNDEQYRRIVRRAMKRQGIR